MGKNNIYQKLAALTLSIFTAVSIYGNCPIDDFDKIISSCTGDNEYGITYEAGVDSIQIEYFQDPITLNSKIGCLEKTPAPAWFAIQIDEEGDLFIEIAHSKFQDIDFACFGPYEGETKKEMLQKVCMEPEKYFHTGYVRIPSDAHPDTTGCKYAPEFAHIGDSTEKYINLSDEIEEYKLEELYIQYLNDEITEADFWEKKDSLVYLQKIYDSIAYTYQTIDPMYYDITSNCFRSKTDRFPDGYMVDCSYSENAREVCHIENAKKGEWYLLAITNYSQKEGEITFQKKGGTATTNCQIIIDATANDVCEGGNIELSVNNAPEGATFNWTGPNGFYSLEKSPVIPNATKIHEGVYSVQMQANGMTSPVVELNVTVNPVYKIDTTIIIELGDKLMFGEDSLENEGLYTHTFSSDGGCDSIVHLQLKVMNQDVNMKSNGPLCEGETLVLTAEGGPSKASFSWTSPHGEVWNGQEISIPNATTNESGQYSLSMDINGKKIDVGDLMVEVRSSFTSEKDTILHGGETIVFGTQNISQSGTYTETFHSIGGCDSVVTLHVYDAARNSKVNAPLCEGETLTISVSDYYPENSLHWFGPNNFEQEGGLEVVIPDVKVSDAGEYIVKTDVFKQTTGDLVEYFTFPVTVYEKSIVDTSITIIEGESRSFGGQALTESGIYTDTFSSSHGCDSIIRLKLIKENLNITIRQNGPICEGRGLELIAEGVPESMASKWMGPNNFSASGNSVEIPHVALSDAGQYTLQCIKDGAVLYQGETEITIMETKLAKDTIFLTEEEPFLLNGASITEPGEYLDTLLSSNGCDSIVTHVVRKITGESNAPLCEGQDLVLSTMGQQTQDNLFWRTPDNQTIQADAQTHIPAVQRASNAGTYTLEIDVNGKNIIIGKTKVDVYPTYQKDTSISIIKGESFRFDAQELTAAGSYSFTKQTQYGCDSIINLTIDVTEANIKVENNGPLCEGERLVISAQDIPDRAQIQWLGPNGFVSTDSIIEIESASMKHSGEYRMEATIGGADIFSSSTDVTIYSSNKVELFDKIIGEHYEVGDVVINKPGKYTFSLKNENGCDSIVTIQLVWALDTTQIIPEAYFSPNGDGVRDTWYIKDVDKYPTSVTIYDRAGKIIRHFETYNNETGWDGKDSMGNDLPSNDYWYIISNSYQDKLFMGHITLLR